MPPYVEVTKISDGLAMDNGTGTISRLQREQLPDNVDLAEVTDEVITSPLILTPVDTDKTGKMLEDDGCGDGRGVHKTFTKDGALHRSLNRAKVFGGGSTMSASVRIGMGKAKGRTLQQTMQDGIVDMAIKEIDFGGHTDNRAEGQNCGCGAIDKAPIIVAAVTRFKDDIVETVQTLGVSTHHLPEVMKNYLAYAQEIDSQDYSGRTTMDAIVNSGRIVKELADDHKETRIVLNFVKGQTVDQEYVRAMTRDRAQVFGVDVWRMQQIANLLNTDENGNLDAEAAEKAFLSELVYTIATAAVLTKGDLPVYAVAASQQDQYELAA